MLSFKDVRVIVSAHPSAHAISLATSYMNARAK